MLVAEAVVLRLGDDPSFFPVPVVGSIVDRDYNTSELSLINLHSHVLCCSSKTFSVLPFVLKHLLSALFRVHPKRHTEMHCERQILSRIPAGSV